MALTFRHQFVNAHVDGADATLAQPSNWNADHVIAGGTKGALLVFDATQTIGINSVAAVASGQVLVSAGVTTLPAWSASPTLTGLVLTSNQFNAGYLRIGAADSVSAIAGDLVVNRGGSPGTGVVYFGGSAALHYLYYDGTNFNLTDSLVPGADNTVSLGTSLHRWQYGYLSTALHIGGNPATIGSIRLAYQGHQYRRNAANSADAFLIGSGVHVSDDTTVGDNSVPMYLQGTSVVISSGSPFLAVGAATASFPALKRDTIFLQLRLADDSGVTGAVTASLPAGAAGRDGNIGFDTTLNAFVYYVGGSRFKLVGTAF